MLKGIKMKKSLKFVPSRLLKSLNLGQQLGQSINFYSLYIKMRLRNMLEICLVFCKPEPQYAFKRYAYKKTCNGLLRIISSIYLLFCISLLYSLTRTASSQQVVNNSFIRNIQCLRIHGSAQSLLL